MTEEKLKKIQNPQVEKGHIDIANEIIEALAVAKLTQLEWSVFMVILRKTWGYCQLIDDKPYKGSNGFLVKKKMDIISLSQFEQLTGGIDKRTVSKVLKRLLQANLIIKESIPYGRGSLCSYGVQKKPLEWKVKFRKPLLEIYEAVDEQPAGVMDAEPAEALVNHPYTKEKVSKDKKTKDIILRSSENRTACVCKNHSSEIANLEQQVVDIYKELSSPIMNPKLDKTNVDSCPGGIKDILEVCKYDMDEIREFMEYAINFLDSIGKPSSLSRLAHYHCMWKRDKHRELLQVQEQV